MRRTFPNGGSHTESNAQYDPNFPMSNRPGCDKMAAFLLLVIVSLLTLTIYSAL